MDRVFVGVFVVIFTVLLLFMALQTIMGETILPVFDEIANTTDFVDQTRYDEMSAFFNNVFLTAFFIIILIPFIWILIRVLKREPTSEPGVSPVIGGP